MVGDLGSAKIHDLGEVDLVAAVGVRSGVFPHQGLAIEVIAAGAVPAYEVVGAVVGSALEERPDLLSTGEHAALLVEDSCDQRRLEDRVGRVRLQQPVDVVGAGPPVPFVMDERRVVVAGGSGARVCVHTRDAMPATLRCWSKCACVMLDR